MRDDQVDELVRQLDVPAHPDPYFTDQSFAGLTRVARTAHERDGRFVGRWLGVLFEGRRLELVRPIGPAFAALLLLALLVLAVVATAIFVGSRRPPGLGFDDPLLVSRGGAVLAIDADGTERATIIKADSPIVGLSRSPDGRTMAFWTTTPTGHQFEVAGVDGSDRRRLGADLQLAWGGCIDVWSPDSSRVAAQVSVDGTPAILVADLEDEHVRVVRPTDGVAECPLWSPGGDLLAFANVRTAGSTLEVMAPDGSAARRVAGGSDGLVVSGANSWSSDGKWIYFDAGDGSGNAIYRADPASGALERLTDESQEAYAPALSPDDRQVSYIASEDGEFSLFVMNDDGTDRRHLLAGATNDGWSGDGRWILAEIQPTGEAPNGGIATVDPTDGSSTIVLPFDRPCPPDGGVSCIDGIAWGQPRP